MDDRDLKADLHTLSLIPAVFRGEMWQIAHNGITRAIEAEATRQRLYLCILALDLDADNITPQQCEKLVVEPL